MNATALLLMLASALSPISCSIPPRSLHRPPPAPEAVELRFNEFFVNPIGPRGLTLTEKLRALEGQRVRIRGYMVQQDRPLPGRFLLSGRPFRVHEEHYGLADDLPPATVHVRMPGRLVEQPVPFTLEPLLLTGTLSVGNLEEPDGRVSVVRLKLDSAPARSRPEVRAAANGPHEEGKLE